MYFSRLADAIRESGADVFVDTTTEHGFANLKRELVFWGHEYIGAEVAAVDAEPLWFVLSSTWFRGGEIASIGKNSRGKACDRMKAHNGAAWLESLGRTVKAERYKVQASARWAAIIQDKKE